MKRIVCGPRAVTEALRAASGAVHLVVVDASAAGATAIEREAARCRVEVRRASKAALDGLAAGVRHQGVIAVTGDFPYLDLDAVVDRSTRDGPALFVALDQIQDVQNVGSILRSGVALGATGFLLCRHGAARVTPAAVRVSAGASEHAAVAVVTNLARSLEELKERGLRVVGLDAAGTVELAQVDLAAPTVLVLGSEGAGLRRLVARSCDILAAVRLAGPVESLNVAVTAALALYEARRQRRTVP